MDLIEIRSIVENCMAMGILGDTGFDVHGDMKYFAQINACQKSIAKRINSIAKEMGLKPLLLAF